MPGIPHQTSPWPSKVPTPEEVKVTFSMLNKWKHSRTSPAMQTCKLETDGANSELCLLMTATVKT